MDFYWIKRNEKLKKKNGNANDVMDTYSACSLPLSLSLKR